MSNKKPQWLVIANTHNQITTWIANELENVDKVQHSGGQIKYFEHKDREFTVFFNPILHRIRGFYPDGVLFLGLPSLEVMCELEVRRQANPNCRWLFHVR